jgi:hypothetical protein
MSCGLGRLQAGFPFLFGSGSKKTFTTKGTKVHEVKIKDCGSRFTLSLCLL